MFNDDEISYEQVKETTNPDIMIEYCKQGVVENTRIHDEPSSVWESGKHIAMTYLDHCDHEIPAEVIDALDAWIKEKQESGK
jgi:hypothetical protein